MIALLLGMPEKEVRDAFISFAVRPGAQQACGGSGNFCLRHEGAQAFANLRKITAALRRIERCRMVVENSVRLGELEMQRAPASEQAELQRASMMALAEPI